MLFLGVTLTLAAAIIVVKGNIPFLSNYTGIREGKEVLHCRIEGGAGMAIGIIMVLQHFEILSAVTMIIFMAATCILAVGIEVGLRVIK